VRSVGARVTWIAVFAAAMGWLEGVVVVYIRGLLGFAKGAASPPAEEMVRALGGVAWLVPTEQTREAATIVMLVALAALAGTTPRSRLGAFLAAFGIWDITYYVALYALVGWPPSLATRDLLFLIPQHPFWVQPVWVPVVISSIMIAAGIALQVDPRRLGPDGLTRRVQDD